MRRTTFILITAAMAVSLSGCAEWIVDAELEKLCKSEGGIKVFEKVELDANQFRPDGYPIFLESSTAGLEYENQLGPAYRLIFHSSEIDKILWVKLIRSSESVIRVSDGKVLGQLQVFSRYGGGVPLSEGAGKICPEPPFGLSYIKSIFIPKK